MDFHPHAALRETGVLHKVRGCNILVRLPGRSRWAEPDRELSGVKLIYLCLFLCERSRGILSDRKMFFLTGSSSGFQELRYFPA